METPQEYVLRTESAVRHLFAGIDDYMRILHDARPRAFVGTFQNDNDYNVALERWATENQHAIQHSLEAQRAFLAEKYALATLCGALLQVASTAIRLYSQNPVVPPEFVSLIKPDSVPARYCIGRLVRGVPIGLAIYAGRNQYNHIDDDQLREPNVAIFERLATGHTYGTGIRDPAFDLNSGLIWNFPSNIMSIMNWRTYDVYEQDMRNLLDI